MTTQRTATKETTADKEEIEEGCIYHYQTPLLTYCSRANQMIYCVLFLFHMIYQTFNGNYTLSFFEDFELFSATCIKRIRG